MNTRTRVRPAPHIARTLGNGELTMFERAGLSLAFALCVVGLYATAMGYIL